MIKVSKPSIGLKEQQTITEVLKTGWIGQGKKVEEFEGRCKEIIGCDYFIALSSCTKAIEIALILSGYTKGDEVIVPSLTYASVIQVIMKLGLIPVFVDVHAADLNIDSHDVLYKLTDKTRFILPLHFRGHSCDISRLEEIITGRDIKIIEDAAHAFGSKQGGAMTGSNSYTACFSFGPLKNICCVEGGGIATNDKELAEKIINYRNFGMARSTWERYNTTKPWEYQVVSAGDKCQMSDVNAAMGVVQLGRMEEIKKKKAHIMSRYVNELSGLPFVTIPETSIDNDFLYIFSILIGANKREQFMQYMLEKGIGTAVHYYPAHVQPYFRQYATGSLDVTEHAGVSIVTLPSYTDLTTDEQDHIIKCIKEFVS